MARKVSRANRALVSRPWDELARMQHEVEGLLGPFTRWWPFGWLTGRDRWLPALDLIERKDELVREEKKGAYFYAERSFGAFVRSLLEVHLPKSKETRTKKIEIKAA